MAKSDRLKEEIGWLKVVFGVAVALDASLIGWLVQHYSSNNRLLLAGAHIAVAIVSLAIAGVALLVYRCLRRLEDV